MREEQWTLCESWRDRDIKAQVTFLNEGIHVLVTARWAEVLHTALRCPVTVAAGIHYDRVCRSDLEEIVKTAEDLLEKVLRKVKE